MEGHIPYAFRTAVVTPLIQKANLPSDDLKNCHPVSGLCFICKLVEHVVARQLLAHTSWHIKQVTQQRELFSPKKTEVHLSL